MRRDAILKGAPEALSDVIREEQEELIHYLDDKHKEIEEIISLSREFICDVRELIHMVEDAGWPSQPLLNTAELCSLRANIFERKIDKFESE